MKLSEVFRRAAERLPEDEHVGMCAIIDSTIHYLVKEDVFSYRDGIELNKAAKEILLRFKPEGARSDAYWIIYEGSRYSKENKVVVKTIKEAQALRKNFLLICAEIAKSEGL